jgi:alpha-L-rhamnosidase
MTWARGHYDSMYGRIESAWKINQGALNCKISIPANTSATFYLPAQSEKDVKESGKSIDGSRDIRFVKYEKGKAVYELPSGSYEFTARVK